MTGAGHAAAAGTHSLDGRALMIAVDDASGCMEEDVEVDAGVDVGPSYSSHQHRHDMSSSVTT